MTYGSNYDPGSTGNGWWYRKGLLLKLQTGAGWRLAESGKRIHRGNWYRGNCCYSSFRTVWDNTSVRNGKEWCTYFIPGKRTGWTEKLERLLLWSERFRYLLTADIWFLQLKGWRCSGRNCICNRILWSDRK